MSSSTDNQTARMPDFCRPRRGVRHTMQSALKSLRMLGVDDARIQIQRIGGGWPAKSVVGQVPAPGTKLDARTSVVLSISAASLVNALPFAMRDVVAGGMGTEWLMPILDTPIAKLETFINDAGGFLELRPDRPATAWRWIREIFALDPGTLPDDLAYRLARFLPMLHQIAGTERGVELGLHALFGLPFLRLDLLADTVPLVGDRHTRLGARNGRLGVSAVIGSGVTVRARAVVTIGPVVLSDYMANDTPEQRRYRDLLYHLVMPTFLLLPVREKWHVLPPPAGLVLDVPDEPVRLGLNTRFANATSSGS